MKTKLSTFYLGTDEASGKPLLYDAQHLTTHAVCVGMTGSGKTGLGIDIIEEAALNQIPAIVIDPKGDMVDLLLPPAGDDREKLAKFNEVEKVVYTPASESGTPLSILSSFAAPPKELRKDKEAMRERILTTTSGLLGLIGIKADPIQSREHILISTLIQQAWEGGQDLDLAMLIDQVQNPPLDKIGALDIDTFYPAKERKSLSISLNNLLASPGFAVWMEGDPLDVEKLLYTKEGKPKIAVLYIAHLTDVERMFFVTLLLNEVIAWMRRQPGTSDLRALLYMDEIFGFFPPSAVPPSKMPMLTLLKQARAFGLGIVLATQNPVDLDYKGLSNCGTWFIGKLQTERDKSRLVEGLESPRLNKLIAETGKRVFILRSVYEKEPVLFKTRNTLSDLQGPLTLEQIAKMTPKKKSVASKKVETISGLYVRTTEKSPHYMPYALCETKKLTILAPITDKGIDWDKGENNPKLVLDRTAQPGATFAKLPDVNIALSFKDFFCKNDPKRVQLEDKLQKAEEKLKACQSKARWRVFDTVVSAGSTIAGIFFGRKKISKGTIDKAGTSFRRAGKISKDSETITQAEEAVQACQKQLDDYDCGSNPLEIEKTQVVWKPSP